MPTGSPTPPLTVTHIGVISKTANARLGIDVADDTSSGVIFSRAEMHRERSAGCPRGQRSSNSVGSHMTIHLVAVHCHRITPKANWISFIISELMSKLLGWCGLWRVMDLQCRHKGQGYMF